MDEIEELEASDSSSLAQQIESIPPPIILKGIGEITIFGLNCKYENEFPSQLLGRLAPEEFSRMILKINQILKRNVPSQLKFLLVGFGLCICSFGFSMIPVVCFSKRTRLKLKKLIELENHRIYRKLGLEWKLVPTAMENSHMLEYVIEINFIPKIPLTRPD